jgi:vitamin B12 transporter
VTYRLLLSSCCLAAVLPVGAVAQGIPDGAIVTPDVIVSGGLTPVPERSFARANTVIDAAEIERRNPRSLAELLQGVPGIAIARSGGPGGLTQIRLRGAEANQVLILIDGVEQANSASNPNLGNLRPELVERIEVVRGPQSALFGSGATAGTINIITKGGRVGRFFTAEAEGGTAPSGRVSLLAEGGTERGTVAASVSYVDDDGWDISGDGGEKDGMSNLTLNLRGQADLTDFMRLRGNFRYTDREAEFDAAGGVGTPADYVQDTRGFYAEGEDIITGLAFDVDTLGGALVHTPSFSFARSENENNDSFPFSDEASTLKLGYQAAYSFGAEGQHTVVGALQFKDETYDTSLFAEERSRSQIGYVLDYRGFLTEALFVQAGLRFDDNEDFDDFLSFGVSASYAVFSTGTTLRASVGRAQTNPEFFQQFGFFGTFRGNPDLKPEQNLGFDVGIDQRLWDDRITIGATYFNETLSDAIVGSGNTVTNAPGDTDRQGVELAVTAMPIEGLTLSASYTYLDVDADTDAGLVRRPEHTAALGAVYSFLGDRAEIGVDVLLVGEAKDLDFSDPAANAPPFVAPLVTLDAYTVIDLSARYAITDTVEVFGSVKNLLDEDYNQVLGYAEQPLTGFLGLRARF